MKKIKISLLAIAACVSISAYAQNVDDIINKEIDAVGGKDKISQVTSVNMEANAQMMNNDMPLKITIVYGKGYKSEMEMNGQQFVTCFTDKGGWMINPMMGGTTPQPMPDEQYKISKVQLEPGGALYNYKEKGYKAELQGQEKVGDINAYKIKLTTADGTDITYYVDPSTYYIIRALVTGNFNGQSIDITTNFSDYKKTDFGNAIPWKIETDYGGQFTMPITVTKVEVNKPVDASIFEMPKQ